jgi:ABC-type transport system substrate-binding protein
MQVTLKLSTPDPMLPYGLDQDGMAGDVVGPAGLTKLDSLGSTTNGAGQYVIDPKATILNSQYVYVKNPYYWDPAAQKWDKIVIKIISDGNALLSALKTGQVQVAEGAATEAADAEAAGLRILSAPSAMLGMYIGDIDGKIVPALKDVRVRQALNYAIDRKGIVESLYGKYGKPTDQFVPQGIGGYLPKLEDMYPYDPKKAKDLLAEAGFKDGVKFTLVEQPAVSSGDLLAQAMVANWKDIGVDVTLKPTDSFATYVPIMLSQKYPATTLTFQYSVQLTDTQQLVTNPALYNYMGFTDPKANGLADAQRKQNIDSPQGVAAAEASETYMVEGAFLVPVASVDALLFATKGVGGLEFTTYPWTDPTNWTPAK